MSKEHHKEMNTLKAGTGEKLVFNSPNQKRTEKSRAVVFHAFQSTIRSHFSVLPIFTPFDFLYSVWVLGLLAWNQAPQWGKQAAKKIGESLGRGRVAPSTLSQSTARLALLVGFFFLLTKLVHLSFFKAFTHFLFLTLYTLQEFNKTLTADLITSSEEFLVWNRIIEVWA